MITYANVQDKVNDNLADFSNIVPEKHRETMQTMLDYVFQYSPLYAGSINISDVAFNTLLTVTFPSLGTSNYYVIGSIRSNRPAYTDDVTLQWVFKDPTPTGFKLGLHETAGTLQNATFFYEIKKIIT
jgi:hypothetical protein